MSQRDRLVQFFRQHGNKATLGMLLENGFYKFTARMSELRNVGYAFDVELDHDSPNRNLYTMREPITVKVESNGQQAFA